MRSGHNNLSIEAYAYGDTTPLPDATGELRRAEGVSTATGYPGGLYMDGSFYVSRDVVRSWVMQRAYRVVIRNGLLVVYEGYLGDLETQVDDAAQGIVVNLVGAWGDILMTRTIRKSWAESRIDERTWVRQTDATGNEVCFIDRDNRIRFEPKAEAWTNGWYAAVRLTAPTGETWKKFNYDYTMAEGAQAWELAVHNVGNGATEASYTSSGSATAQSQTFGTATASFELRFYARAGQTPTSNGAYYGEFRNIMAYSEIGEISLKAIAGDCIGYLSADLNSSEALLGTPGSALSLVPFVQDRYVYWADVLTDAAARGDGSYNAWAVQLLDSESAPTPNGKPILKTEQIPSLTDGGYDYVVRLDDPNLLAPYRVTEDRAAVRNWIIIGYSDAEDNDNWLTPDDDATLTDATSVANYGERHEVLWLGDSTAEIAAAAGRKLLAMYKDPPYRVGGPITVQGYIRDQYGSKVPASQIVAGKRLRIANYLEPQNLGATVGLTVLITMTRYDDNREVCQMYCGKLDTLLIPQVVFAPQLLAGVEDGGGGSGGGRETLNWKRKWGLPKELWEASKSWTWKQKQEWIAQARAKKRKRG